MKNKCILLRIIYQKEHTREKNSKGVEMESRFTFTGMISAREICDIAQGTTKVSLSPEVLQSLERCGERADLAAQSVPVYGRSTGVGANKTTEARLDRVEQGMDLLRSHSVQSGSPYSQSEVRAMVAVRLNQLCNPGSGIETRILEGLCNVLSSETLPTIKRFGAVGTADLSALANLGLAMVGEKDGIPKDLQIEPISSESALPLISSSAMTIGSAILICDRLRKILAAETVAYALTLAAAKGNLSPFTQSAIDAVCVETTSAVAAQVLYYIQDCKWEPKQIQDIYALRAFLPARASTMRSLDRLEQQAVALANCAQENPLFPIADLQGDSLMGTRYGVIHHGAFLETALAHELDGMALSLAQEVPLMLSRITMLNDSRHTGLPRFLAPRQAGTSGTMIVEYVAASAAGEIYTAASPAGAYSAVLSNGLEEDASYATTSAGKLQRAVDALETIVACELLEAVRACHIGGTDAELPEDGPLAKSIAMTDTKISKDMDDRSLSDDLETLRKGLEAYAEI